jgi:hypothetical protein
VATVNVQIIERLFVSAGSRTLRVDYDDDATRIDATIDGPLLGITWRFGPLDRGAVTADALSRGRPMNDVTVPLTPSRTGEDR